MRYELTFGCCMGCHGNFLCSEIMYLRVIVYSLIHSLPQLTTICGHVNWHKSKRTEPQF